MQARLAPTKMKPTGNHGFDVFPSSPTVWWCLSVRDAQNTEIGRLKKTFLKSKFLRPVLTEPSSNSPEGNLEALTDSQLGSVSLLLRDAKNGCPSSREKLLRRFQEYLSLLAKKKRDTKLAAKLGVSDIVQQSLMKADTSFETFRGEHEGQWKAWLKMLLVNEVRQTSRHFSRGKRAVSREVTRQPSDDSTRPNESLVSKSPAPDANAIQREQLGQLTVALEGLSDDYRTVIQLRSIQRLSMADVAKQMDRSVEATAKLWYRAIQKLKSVMPDVDRTH